MRGVSGVGCWCRQLYHPSARLFSTNKHVFVNHYSSSLIKVRIASSIIVFMASGFLESKGIRYVS